MGRTGVFVLVALVVAGATFLIVNRDDPPATTPGSDVTIASPSPAIDTATPAETPTQAPPEAPPGFDAYRNRAGYAFHYPQGWNLDERRTAVEIVAPDASIAMSFGIAPEGDPRRAMGKLLEAIEERYDVDAVRGPADATVGTTEGVSVSGEAVNADGVDIGFTAFVVEGRAGNYGITVFSADRADDAEIRSILDSFTTF